MSPTNPLPIRIKEYVSVTRFSGALALVVILFILFTDAASAQRVKYSQPDFTKGDTIPEIASHNWTLGATGARGWIYAKDLSTGEARQIRIMEVADDSPATGILEVGDVILGIGSEPFASDARIAFAKALTAAESTAGGGKLRLLRWRDGKQEQVTLDLPVLGDYSPTAPYECAKSKAILAQGSEALAATMRDPDYGPNPVARALSALGLLASGNKDYRPLLKEKPSGPPTSRQRDSAPGIMAIT
jgi:hypothetical protein